MATAPDANPHPALMSVLPLALLIALPIAYYRVNRIYRMFEQGVEIVGELTEKTYLMKGRVQIAYSYRYRDEWYQGEFMTARGKFTRNHNLRDKITLYIDERYPESAVVKELFS